MDGFSLILIPCTILSPFWGAKASSAQGAGWVSLKMGSVSQGLAVQGRCQQEMQGRGGFGENPICCTFWGLKTLF